MIARATSRGFALVLLTATSCANNNPSGADAPQATPLLPTVLQMFPECRAEIQAFVDLTKLARQFGEDWPVFQDAIEEMKAQVIDCATDDDAAVITIGHHARKTRPHHAG